MTQLQLAITGGESPLQMQKMMRKAQVMTWADEIEKSGFTRRQAIKAASRMWGPKSNYADEA